MQLWFSAARVVQASQSQFGNTFCHYKRKKPLCLLPVNYFFTPRNPFICSLVNFLVQTYRYKNRAISYLVFWITQHVLKSSCFSMHYAQQGKCASLLYYWISFHHLNILYTYFRFIYFYFLYRSICLHVCLCPTHLFIFIFCIGVFACMYVCVPHMCLLPAEARIGHWISLELELQAVVSHQRCWELNSGLMPKQQVFFCIVYCSIAVKTYCEQCSL